MREGKKLLREKELRDEHAWFDWIMENRAY
jgi:hypothetical protein